MADWRTAVKYQQYVPKHTAYLLDVLGYIFPFNLDEDVNWPKDCQFAVYLENAVVAGLITRIEQFVIRQHLGLNM